MTARILVVDDTIPAAKLLAAKLTSEYYDVKTATNGPEALEVVRDYDPDLVLLDVMMPGMDGFDVCREMKKMTSRAHIPVVMVTALSETEDRIAGLDAGADDFLSKPVDDSLLLARVGSLIRLKRLHDQWRMQEITAQSVQNNDLFQEMPKDDGRNAEICLIQSRPIEGAEVTRMLKTDGDSVYVLDGEDEDPDFIARQVLGMMPELVIISLGENEGDGLRCASKIMSREATRDIPILLIADDDEMSSLLKGLEFGVNDFILRPLEENELLARVRMQICRKRYHDHLKDSFLCNLSMALTDSLTNLHNRRYLEAHLGALMDYMKKIDSPLTLLMLDIDFFKQVNDDLGHPVGDKVLCEIARRISLSIRAGDQAIRFGGEEFIVVMPDTAQETAEAIAERLRQRIRERPIRFRHHREGESYNNPQAGEHEIHLTISIGVAEMMKTGDHPDRLIERADTALYKAKESGRDRVEVWTAEAD